MESLFKHRFVLIASLLALAGVATLALSQLVEGHHLFGIDLARTLADTGSLFLIVGILHWVFDVGMRNEMLREVSSTLSGHTRLHDAGMIDALRESKRVDERAHWATASALTIVLQYSPEFFKTHHELLAGRVRAGRPTEVLLLDPTKTFAKFLEGRDSKRTLRVSNKVKEVTDLLQDLDSSKRLIHIRYHNEPMRYMFIGTDEFIWVKFYTNSNGIMTVPALKVRADSPLGGFFSSDTKRLWESSRGQT